MKSLDDSPSTVAPSAAASSKVALTASIADLVHVQSAPGNLSNSGYPQLMEITDGAFAASCTAW